MGCEPPAGADAPFLAAVAVGCELAGAGVPCFGADGAVAAEGVGRWAGLGAGLGEGALCGGMVGGGEGPLVAAEAGMVGCFC